jgi:hypothetical protein
VLVILKRKSRPIRARKRMGPMGVAKTVRQVGAAMAGGSGELRRGWLAFNSGRARNDTGTTARCQQRTSANARKKVALPRPFVFAHALSQLLALAC